MGGQGKRKRTREGPSRENEAGFDLTRNVQHQHPLLNDLVMEVVFQEFLLLDHYDPRKSAVNHLAKLRLVCKAWDKEIMKLIQRDTRINLNRLVKPYPNGMGWKATNTGFEYAVPRPELIGTYDNLKVIIKSCKDFVNGPILKWFQVMGSSVKSLHLTCSLSCFHQHRFVELILKKWCPNLVSFKFQGVKTFESLIQNSFFTESSLEDQCTSLKEFVLSLDVLQCDSPTNQWTDFCDTTCEVLEEKKQFQSVDRRKIIDDYLSGFSKDVIRFVDGGGKHVWRTSNDDLLDDLVGSPIGLSSVEAMTPRAFGSHNAKFFQENFMCDPGFETDGGIIGQLMRMSKVESLVIQKMDERHEWFFHHLFAMFFYRPNLWSSSVQDFQCVGFCPAIFAHGNHILQISRGYPVEMIPKKVFSKVGFPLKRLKFATVFLHRGDSLVPECLDSILRGYAGTLEELEIVLRARKENHKLIIPKLPSLKVLVMHMNGDRVVRLTGQDILNKLPKLERCEVMLGKTQENKTSANGFFGGDDGLWRDVGIQSHPLKEFTVLDEYLNKKDIERMILAFPNLKSVDVSIVLAEGVYDLKAFWEEMGGLARLERVKISFQVKKLKLKWNKDCTQYEKAIVDNIDNFKTLQWLELEHKGQHPFSLAASLANKIAKATKLRFFKLTNFQVEGKVTEEVKKNLPNAVLQLHAAGRIASSDGRRLRRRV